MVKYRMLWGLMVFLSIGLVACSQDEPTPPEEPNQPENPGGTDDPGDPVEDWEDETPHGFYFDIDSIDMPLTEDGFLQFWDKKHQKLCDVIVMEERYRRQSNDNRSKNGILPGGSTGSRSYLLVLGKKANPWINVEQYIKMCQTIHLRADSKFSNFPELEGLPVSNLQKFGTMTLETLINVDVISHNYFCANIPAGSSMRGPENLMEDPYVVYALLQCISGEPIFKEMQKGPYIDDGPGPTIMSRIGNLNIKYIYSSMELWLIDYPDEPGDYPMTLRMEFASGKVLTKDFKVRYVNEE